MDLLINRISILRKIYVLLFCLKHPNYWQDRLITAQRPDSFMSDDKFLKAFSIGKETGSWPIPQIHWRIHIMIWAAGIALNTKGDFIECGVNLGGFAKAIMAYHQFNKTGRTYYLCDTFEGGKGENLFLLKEKNNRNFYKHYKNTFDRVKEIFSKDEVVLVKGLIPKSLEKVKGKKFAYISMDLNSAKAEYDALKILWPQLSGGGVIVFDDHSFVGYEESLKLHTQFAKEVGVDILCLPTGQGIIIKN